MAAGEQDGAHYEGVLQCHFGGRAFADGAWAQGDGVQAFPRGQLLAGCLSRKGRTERRAHTGWRTHGAPPGTGVNVPGMDSAVYVVNGSRTSCNACRCALRTYLQELASAREGQGAGGGTAHGAAVGGAAFAGAASRPVRTDVGPSAAAAADTGVDMASDHALIFSLATRNALLVRRLKGRSDAKQT